MLVTLALVGVVIDTLGGAAWTAVTGPTAKVTIAPREKRSIRRVGLAAGPRKRATREPPALMRDRLMTTDTPPA